MPTTTNFGWTTPADTDLVKDGAAAIRTLGNGIDTSLLDLKGGTTGQVLAKASNTDLDFTWSSVDPLTILDAKGDLISATAADTPARLAVGANGTVLTADSAEATGLKWATPTSGGMTLLNAGGTTLTGASVTISSIPSTYNALYILVRNFRGATDGTQLRMRTNISASNYATINPGDTNPFSGGSDPSWYLTDNQDNTVSQSIVKGFIYDYANTTTWKILDATNNITNDATTTTQGRYLTARCGVLFNTAAVTDLVFSCSSGNLSAGTVFVYGVK